MTMMRDWVTLGQTPADEECAQVGTDGYAITAQAECKRYIELIRKKHDREPLGAKLRMTSNPHDFGTYFDVSLDVDDAFPEALKWARKVEDDPPTTWDDDH